MPACKLIWINSAGSSNLNVMVSCSANFWIDVMTGDYELTIYIPGTALQCIVYFCKSILTTTYKPRCDEYVEFSPTSNGEKRPLLYSHPTKHSNLSSKYHPKYHELYDVFPTTARWFIHIYAIHKWFTVFDFRGRNPNFRRNLFKSPDKCHNLRVHVFHVFHGPRWSHSKLYVSNRTQWRRFWYLEPTKSDETSQGANR